MYKGKSRSMQRGGTAHDRSYMDKNDFYSGTKIELTEAEVNHFHFGANDVASFTAELEPIIRVYAKNGFRKPADVSRLLNKDNRLTACGDPWTPRLAWFLLKLMFESPSNESHRSVGKKRAARLPSGFRTATARAESTSARTGPVPPLTKEEIAKRLSAIGRVKRESDG